jgi:hypothetical protein
MARDSAQAGSGRAVATRSRGGGSFEYGRANNDPKTTVSQFFKFDILLAPNRLQCLDGRASRLSLALLQLVDRPLRQADANAKFRLAPAKHSAR